MRGNGDVGLLAKLNPRMTNETFEKVEELRAIKIDDSGRFTRKKFAKDAPELFIVRIEPIGLRESRKESFFAIDHRAEADHELTALPGGLDLEGKHHLECRFLSLLGKRGPFVFERHCGGHWSGRLLRIDDFQPNRDNMSANPTITSHQEAGAFIFHVAARDNLHRDLLHLPTKANFAGEEAFLVSR